MATKEESSSQSSNNIIHTPSVPASEDERRRMIAEAAYYHAEHRGFQGGDIDQDWLLGEAEIESLLSEKEPH